MSYVRNMVVWASGLIEFLTREAEPDGAIVVCTVRHPHAFEELLAQVQDHSILHDFGDSIGLRVPGIDPKRQHVEVGVDNAVEHLIHWEDDLRDKIGDDAAIEWTRS